VTPPTALSSPRYHKSPTPRSDRGERYSGGLDLSVETHIQTRDFSKGEVGYGGVNGRLEGTGSKESMKLLPFGKYVQSEPNRGEGVQSAV